MHNSLADSPIIEKNKEILKKYENIFFTKPRKEEGKDKLPNPEELALNISHIFNSQKYFKNNERNVLISLGGTRTMIDPVRCITNLSTGSLGIETAKVFYAMGVKIHLLVGNINKELPNFENSKIDYLPDYNEMYNYLKKLNTKKYDGIIHLIAGSDFTPKTLSHSKISSKNETLTIELIKLKKIIDLDNLNTISYQAGAKLTSGDEKNGLEIAKKLLIEKNLNSVLYSNTNDTWKKEKEHSATFLEINSNKIIEKESK